MADNPKPKWFDRVSWAAILDVDGVPRAHPGTVSASEAGAWRRLLSLTFAASQQKKHSRKTLMQKLRRAGWQVGTVKVVKEQVTG